MADLDFEAIPSKLDIRASPTIDSNSQHAAFLSPSSAHGFTLLETSTLLNWVNHQISHPITSLSDLADGCTITALVTDLSDRNTGAEREERSLTEMLQQWVGVPELPIRVSQAPFDTDQITSLLGFIHAQYQARTIRSLQGDPYVHIFDSQPTATPADISHALLAWAQAILQDYTNDALLDPIHDCANSWRNGFNFLSMLHFYEPSLVPDLDSHMVAKQPQHTLSTAFQLAHDTFHIPYLLDVNAIVEATDLDSLSVQVYLTEFAKATARLEPAPLERRLADIERWKLSLHTPQVDYSIPVSPSPSSVAGSDAGEDLPPNAATTRTSKYTLQQVRITKTTNYKQPDGTDFPMELEKFDNRAASLLDKIIALQHRFELVAPTRSSNYHAPVPSSASPEERHTPLDDATDAASQRSGGSESEGIVHALHPLTAAEQDLMAYKINLKALEAARHSLHADDLTNLQQYILSDLDVDWRTDPKVLERMERIDGAFHSLTEQAKQEEQKLTIFCRGFSFAQMCTAIRSELELVQTKMVKSTTTDPDIQDLEMRVEKTSAMTETLKSDFSDLLLIETGNEAYMSRLEDVVRKNDLVRTWVEEVRVWFAEAERIRQWIMIRHERLGETTLPEALASDELPAERSQVDAWNAKHAILEREIKQFDEEDMTRLRAHVKSLTSADRIGKDLSPADTTTIEITLTTLSALDKLMYALRLKSDGLHVLTLRVTWEYEYIATLAWIHSTNKDVEDFLCNDARWLISEDETAQDNTLQPGSLSTAKANLNEIAVQRLLELEHRISEFEQGQYSDTLNTFQDLDDTTNDAIPEFLELRQTRCEDLFSSLRKRMEFARNVVEQRLSIVSFLHQANLVNQDAQQLLLDLKEGKQAAYKWEYDDDTDNGSTMTERVHNIRECIVQLVKVTGNQVLYPVPKLDIDVAVNTSANETIRQVIEMKQDELNALSKELDERLWSLKNVLQLHNDARVLTGDATRLSEWAEDRIRQMQKAKLGIDTLTIDDLKQSERESDSLIAKLSNGKINDVADLVKKFDGLLERTEKSLDTPSIDSDELAGMAQHLSQTSRHLTDTFDRLKRSLDEQQLELQMLRKKMEDGHSYFETANSLRAFIGETLTSMPGLKQTCGFMTGQSEEKDQQRLDMLNSALDELDTNFSDRKYQYEQVCARFQQMEPDQVDDLASVHRFQQALEQGWEKLSRQMDALKQFRDTVSTWHERHQRLNMTEQKLLVGLGDDIKQMAASGWSDDRFQQIESRLDTALQILEATGKEIVGADTKEDPLQTANYSCARDRHLALSAVAQAAQFELNTLKEQALELQRQRELAKATVEPPTKEVEIARKIKEIMSLVGDIKGRAASVRICSRPTKADDGLMADMKAVLCCPLSLMPTERQSLAAEAKLDALERDIDQNLYAAIEELDEMLAANTGNTDLFVDQRSEINDAVRGLTLLMKSKRDALAEAGKLEGFLTVTEELEVLLSALAEIVDRASPELARTMYDGAPSRADLQAMLIDLDTRYQYYDPKIEDLMQEAKDTGRIHMSDRRVVECLEELEQRWADLKVLATLKKSELRARIGPLADSFVPSHTHTHTHTHTHLNERGRKAMSMIIPSGQRPMTPSDARPPRPQSMQSTPRLMSATNASRAGARPASRARTTTGNVSPTARRVAAVRAVAAQRKRESLAASETYVADPKNDLDVALGDIVNDSPYRVAVKMVPGEVGKYWFGNIIPKLAYCRILRSRMVMVRVGGGWVELSQFLRDHALLSGGNVVARAAQPNMADVQEGCFRTYSPNGMVTIRGGGVSKGGAGGAVGEGAIFSGGRRSPLICESKSTPFNRGGSPIFGHGIKEGNKYVVTLDGQGNQVEVKMTKANSKTTNKFFTPRWTHTS